MRVSQNFYKYIYQQRRRRHKQSKSFQFDSYFEKIRLIKPLARRNRFESINSKHYWLWRLSIFIIHFCRLLLVLLAVHPPSIIQLFTKLFQILMYMCHAQCLSWLTDILSLQVTILNGMCFLRIYNILTHPHFIETHYIEFSFIEITIHKKKLIESIHFIELIRCRGLLQKFCY